MAILLGIPLTLIFGAFLEWALFSHLYKRDHLEQVLLTFGLILIFEELRSLLVGDEVHGVDIPAMFSGSIQLSEVLSYPVYRLVISGVCIVLAVALYFLIQRTRLGMMIRAGNHDRTMVEALGININMITASSSRWASPWPRWPACSPHPFLRCTRTWAAVC